MRLKSKEEEIKEDEKKGSWRAAAIAGREEKKKEKEEAKSEFNRVMGEAEQEEKVMKEATATEYREKHPDANNTETRRNLTTRRS